MPPRKLEIAPLASRELNEILDYTEETCGLEQALNYSEALLDSFDLLCSFPDMGKVRNDVDAELRSVLVQEHHVFYRVFPDLIRIIRIVHVGRDPALAVDNGEDA